MEIVRFGKDQAYFKEYPTKIVRVVGRFEAKIKNFFSKLFFQGPVAIKYDDVWLTRSSMMDLLRDYEKNPRLKTIKKKDELINRIDVIGTSRLSTGPKSTPNPKININPVLFISSTIPSKQDDMPFYYYVGNGTFTETNSTEWDKAFEQVFQKLSPGKKGINIHSTAEKDRMTEKIPFVAVMQCGARLDEVIGPQQDGNFLTKLPSEINLLLVILHPNLGSSNLDEVKRLALQYRPQMKESQIVFSPWDHVYTYDQAKQKMVPKLVINEDELVSKIKTSLKTFDK